MHTMKSIPMNNKDLNYIVKVEKAIAKKYGEEAIQNPRANWNEDKEQDYLEQIKILHKKEIRRSGQRSLCRGNKGNCRRA